ncbi:hypothetical protein RI129_002055 [Pyrocoelia pectoralis]|uniref:BZIP domain-containing protein n=1 Tax=Pyrocoelia pectoralis TaxID=417401 RepID=A0AAN7VLL5_9COLE
MNESDAEGGCHIHKRKHNVGLHLGINSGNSNTDDQTPTPTRFIRNCEEVGLFQDLQNVNPFEETFRIAATELATHGSLHLPPVASSDDSLHTPHIFPPILQEEKYSNSDDDFSVNDNILIIDESEVSKNCHRSTFNFNTLEGRGVSVSKVVTNTKGEVKSSPSQKNDITSKSVVKPKCLVHLQIQRELNRAAQVRSRAKKKLMFHKLAEEVSLLKSQTKQLAKENEKLKKEVVWLKTMLLYHKDCPVSKDPRIMDEVNLLAAKATEEKLQQKNPVATMLVPIQSNLSSQLPQLVTLQPINTAVLVQVPTALIPNPHSSKLTPLLPKVIPAPEPSGVSIGIVGLDCNNSLVDKKGTNCAKLRHANKQLSNPR